MSSSVGECHSGTRVPEFGALVALGRWGGFLLLFFRWTMGSNQVEHGLERLSLSPVHIKPMAIICHWSSLVFNYYCFCLNSNYVAYQVRLH